jgi:hypothetical protein
MATTSTNKLTQMRALNGEFARSYKYKFSLTKVGTALSAIANAPTDAQFSTSCLNVVMPSVGVQEITVEVGIHTMRLNGRHETSGTISPEFLLTGDYAVYKFFRAWANLAANHEEDTQTANSGILATITIEALNITDTTAVKVKLNNAWCRSCPEITFSDDSNDIVRFAPEIVYDFAVTE